MEKGFYLIGCDKENSKTYIFGIDKKRFDTLEQAEAEQEKEYHENMGIDLDIQILEVE